MEKQKIEALERMRFLSIAPEVIEKFKDTDKLSCSDLMCHMNVPAEIQAKIDKWQKDFGNLVYYVIHCHNIHGMQTYECLTVSPFEEDWSFEREIMKNRYVISHSINLTRPEFTESGSILVGQVKGHLIRLY